MKLSVLFPADCLDEQRVDTEFTAEWEAAGQAGLQRILFSQLLWDEQQKLRLYPSSLESDELIYRGWMMKPEIYRSFYLRLVDAGLQPITDPDAYALLHLYPGIAPAFGSDTGKLMTISSSHPVSIEEVRAEMDSFVMKDEVKSVKGTRFPMQIASSVSQEEFNELRSWFCALRGPLLTGRICLKEYFNLKRYGSRTNEWRVIYCAGEMISKEPNSGQPAWADPVPDELTERYAALPSPFYTVDYAQLTDGSWKVIEAGDGGVSGLSNRQNPVSFF